MNEQNLSSYESGFDRPDDYYDRPGLTVDFLVSLCKLKDRSTAMFDKRWQSAKDVIDLVAKRIGIDPDDTDHWLYGLVDGRSPLADKLDEYFDRSGDKVKLKKRIDELETENSVLRSLIGK